MPLSLEDAYLVLRKLVRRPNHVVMQEGAVIAWFFEPTSDANIEYEIRLNYDGNRLNVSKVEYVQIQPPATWDITKRWAGDPIVERVVKIARDALELGTPDSGHL